MKKRKLRVFRSLVFAVFLFAGLIALVNWVLDSALNFNPREETRSQRVSEQVLEYEPLVARYAKEKGVSEYTDVLLAIIMQESGGRGKDPMQSSESSCGKRGCIKNPDQSIKAGVAHFANMLNDADGDLELAVQSYNFGRGFITYAKKESGGYTQDTAIDFSKKMYAKVKDKEKYRCIRPDSKKFDACYGDIYYVKSVMAYRPAIASES
ncbi:lysozyme family protein [Aciduricibacillus chroicocephali]|uniref:Lysozyme family protein n=1 Tax=Aciduricibacillus chroicocephali TaxID=3054939 RepID=A0ABY9KUT9_9BACI|nr:lysozyme family protein [Bacillaceae bacterium 44XB]